MELEMLAAPWPARFAQKKNLPAPSEVYICIFLNNYVRGDSIDASVIRTEMGIWLFFAQIERDFQLDRRDHISVLLVYFRSTFRLIRPVRVAVDVGAHMFSRLLRVCPDDLPSTFIDATGAIFRKLPSTLRQL